MKPLIILQQPLDVIEFDLRALRIGEAAAEFFQNAANPLHVDFAGDLHRVIVTVFVSAQRPSERIGAIGAALLPTDAIAGAIALSLIALLHRLRETLGALAQRIQRAALRIHGAIGVTFAELAAGIAHRGIGFAEAVLALTLLGVLARLPLLTLLAALALSHTALGKLLLQLLEPFTQAILILLQIAHALIALLAAHAIAPRILALLEGLVAQLLLLADHVTHFVQRVLERLLRGPQGLVRIGDVAILDGGRERPRVGGDLAHGVVGAGSLQLPRDTVGAEIVAGFGREQFRRDHQRLERRIHLRVLVGIEGQNAALLDQRPRQRFREQPLRNPHVERFAAALIAGLVLRRQGQGAVGAGIRILTQILDRLSNAIAGPRIRKHKRKLRRVEQRPRRAPRFFFFALLRRPREGRADGPRAARRATH